MASETTAPVTLTDATPGIAALDRRHHKTEIMDEKSAAVPGSRPHSGSVVHDPESGSESSSPLAASDMPPDGGTNAWLCVLGAWCASFVGYGWINSIGTWQEYYQNGPLSDYSPSQISWITSLQVFFMSVLGPVTGQIYDRYGINFLVRVGSVMHVFGLMMASLSTKYYQFLLSQGVCSSIGVAMVFVCALSCISDWFHLRRGLAFGVVATGSSVGGVVFPIMSSNLIRVVGYGWAMRVDAFLILILLVVANLTLRTRRPPRPVKLTGASLAKPFSELTFNLLIVGLFLMPFGMYVPVTYLPVAALGEGFVSPSMAINLVAFYNATRYVLYAPFSFN